MKELPVVRKIGRLEPVRHTRGKEAGDRRANEFDYPTQNRLPP